MRRSPSLEAAATRAASAQLDSVTGRDLDRTAGFLVADARGRVVGRVEGSMYGTSPETPDGLSVRFSLLRWRRRLVATAAISAIDDRTRVIGLRIDRNEIRAFV